MTSTDIRICDGSGRNRSFSTGDAIAAGGLASKATRARVSCPDCGAKLTARIVTTDHGVRLATPMARLPKHAR